MQDTEVENAKEGPMRGMFAVVVLAGAMGVVLVLPSPGDEVSDRVAIQKVLDAHGIVAIVDGDSYAAGLRDEQGKELPPSFSRYMAVLVKDGGNWKVAAFRSLPQLKSKLTQADMH